MAYQYKDSMVLTEVKKGQFGYGYLVENDGHIITENDTVKQMREDIEHGHEFVCPQHFVVPAVFQKYGIQNANGRIYPEKILRREVDTYINEKILRHCALGALDHPQSSGLSGHDVAHNITELHWDGSTLVGKLELNLTPGFVRYGVASSSGDKVATLLLNGYLIGVSSRGVGSVKSAPGGIALVDDDFSLICWDVVLEPSTPGAYIGKTEQELKQYVETDITKTYKPRIDERITKIHSILG